MRLTTRALAALLLVVLLSACTPQQVTAFFAARGHTVTSTEAKAIADWWNLIAYLRAVDAAKSPETHVREAAREFGIPEGAFVRVIRCESGMNPRAVNPTSGALGLGQHLPRYWPARAAALGYPASAWSDARANARVSAWLWRTSGPQNWVCR